MKKGPLYNLRRFRRLLLRFYLTESGMLMVSGAILAGLLTLPIPAYQIFTTFACLLTLAFILGVVFRPRVRIGGNLPEKIVAGNEVSVRFWLTNSSRWPAYDVALGFDELPGSFKELSRECFIPRLGPGESACYELRFVSHRRGLYELPQPRIFSTFPFNLFRQGPDRGGKHALLVLPDFHQINRVDVSFDTRYQPGGIILASHVGESPEYIGNREFRPGDSTRKIDARAWARLASPVVKEYNEEYYCHIAVVLDTFLPTRLKKRSSGHPQFEAAVSLTASLAEALSRSERIIDFFAAGPDLYVFRTGRHTAPFENLLDILACVKSCRRNPFEIVAPALGEQLSQTSSVVFVLLDWDNHRESMLRMAVQADCTTRVLMVRKKRTSRPFHDAETWAGPFTCLSPEMILAGQLEQL